MDADQIKISDWSRILFGEVPPSFFLEVIIRTVFVFFLLIISMRFFGRRMAAQINRIEIVSLYSLAAAIGVPLQTPDRGLLPAVIIAIVVIVVGRIMAAIAFGNEHLEEKIEDKLAVLANDGVLDPKKFKGTTLTKERVFAQLRTFGVRHLGEVKRLYVEANGSFSIVKEQQPSYGLSVLPTTDPEFLEEQTQCDETVCCTCGKKKKDNGAEDVCSNCKEDQWMKAII